jgi:hypothetical protein
MRYVDLVQLEALIETAFQPFLGIDPADMSF